MTADEVLGPAPEKTRRAIILLTNGVNTYGQKKLDDAVQAALRIEAAIYAIGVGDDFYDGVDKGVLKKITETNGRASVFSGNRRRPAAGLRSNPEGDALAVSRRLRAGESAEGWKLPQNRNPNRQFLIGKTKSSANASAGILR